MLKYAMRLAGAGCLLGGSVFAHAVDDLPAKLEGKWEASQPVMSRPISGTARILVTKKNPDGTFEGKMDYLQGMYCEMNQTPISGRFDGTQLEFTGSFTDKIRNAGCYKDARFVLKRSGDMFEGKAVNISDATIALRLRAQDK